MKEKSYFLVFLSFFFYLFWLCFFLFLHFRFPRCHFFFCSIAIKICSFIASSFIKCFSLHHVYSYSLFFCFFFCLFVLSYSILSVICLWKLFSLSFIWNIVLFSDLPLLILRFPFLKVVISFLIYSILLKHAVVLIEWFGQTCVTKEQSEMLMLMNHPFARPLLHWAVRCTYRP